MTSKIRWKDYAKAKLLIFFEYDGLVCGIADYMNNTLSDVNWNAKATAWLLKKQLVRRNADGVFIITKKGRRYVEKKRLKDNPEYRLIARALIHITEKKRNENAKQI